MRSLTTEQHRSLQALLDENVAAWLVGLEVAAGTMIFLTTNTVAVSYLGKSWQPFPMKVGVFPEPGDGELPRSSITLSNIGAVTVPYLEQRTWDQGDALFYLVDAANPALGHVVELRFAMVGATLQEESVTISLGQPNYLQRAFPAQRYVRDQGYPSIVRNPT